MKNLRSILIGLVIFVLGAATLVLIDDSAPPKDLVSDANPIGIDTSTPSGSVRIVNKSVYDDPSRSEPDLVIELDTSGSYRTTSSVSVPRDQGYSLGAVEVLYIGDDLYSRTDDTPSWTKSSNPSPTPAATLNDFMGVNFFSQGVDTGEITFTQKPSDRCPVSDCRVYSFTQTDKQAVIAASENDPQNGPPAYEEGKIFIDAATNRIVQWIIEYHQLPKSDPDSYVLTGTRTYEYNADIEPIVVPSDDQIKADNEKGL